MTLKQLCFGFACLWSASLYAQDLSPATFNTPTFHDSDNNACTANETVAH